MIMHPILDYSKTNYLGQALKLVPIPLVFCHLAILRFSSLFTLRAEKIKEDETQISKLNFSHDLVKMMGGERRDS